MNEEWDKLKRAKTFTGQIDVALMPPGYEWSIVGHGMYISGVSEYATPRNAKNGLMRAADRLGIPVDDIRDYSGD